MNNVRFATSIHILTLLATQEGQWVPSEYLAGSININPVLVRKELVNLRAHGLVESREGKNGGSRLALSPAKIFFSDVFRAVTAGLVLGKSNTPNPDCPVGREINTHIHELYEDAEAALLRKLGKVSLAAFCKKFS